jgi:hypothetical protein
MAARQTEKRDEQFAAGSWHSYRMPLPLLRLVVAGAGIGGAALFVYIAYIALSR